MEVEYEQMLNDKGLEQIELFGVGGSNKMSKLYDRLISKVEIKKFLLRAPEDVLSEFQEICEATKSSVNEGIVELLRIAVEESRENPKIQKAIKAMKKEKKKSPAKKTTTTTKKTAEETQ